MINHVLPLRNHCLQKIIWYFVTPFTSRCRLAKAVGCGWNRWHFRFGSTRGVGFSTLASRCTPWWIMCYHSFVTRPWAGIGAIIGLKCLKGPKNICGSWNVSTHRWDAAEAWKSCLGATYSAAKETSLQPASPLYLGSWSRVKLLPLKSRQVKIAFSMLRYFTHILLDLLDSLNQH